jgi:hypothetical protein
MERQSGDCSDGRLLDSNPKEGDHPRAACILVGRSRWRFEDEGKIGTAREHRAEERFV